MKIKIFKNNEIIKFNYNNSDKTLNFEELVTMAKWFIELENFKEININDDIFECDSGDLILYKSTLNDLLISLQSDDQLLDIILDADETTKFDT